MTNSSSHKLAQLMDLLQRLKRLKRTGWVDRGVPPPDVESVADHTLVTSLLAWLAALDEPDLDATRVLKLAVVHDLAEAIVGDMPPYRATDVPTDPDARRAFFSVRHTRPAQDQVAKRAAEATAFEHLVSLAGPAAQREWQDLHAEYEAGETAEARFVKEADTLEAYLQSRRYAAEHPDIPLRGFSLMADEELTLPTFTALRDASRAIARKPGKDS